MGKATHGLEPKPRWMEVRANAPRSRSKRSLFVRGEMGTWTSGPPRIDHLQDALQPTVAGYPTNENAARKKGGMKPSVGDIPSAEVPTRWHEIRRNTRGSDVGMPT